jgi:hypothetical protein
MRISNRPLKRKTLPAKQGEISLPTVEVGLINGKPEAIQTAFWEMSDWIEPLNSETVSSCTFCGTDLPPIAAQPVFSPEDNGFDRREAAVECAGNLGITHLLVIAEHQWNLVIIWQSIQLFPNLAFCFLAQNLGERRRSGNGWDGAKITSSDDRAILVLPPA